MNRLICSALFVSISLMTTVAHANPSPTQRSKQLIELTYQVKTTTGAALSDADRAANDKLYKQLDTFIDFQQLTHGPVAPHTKNLSKKQIKTIKTLFQDAIRTIAYPKTGGFLQKAELTWGSETVTGKKAAVDLTLWVESEDLETDITFHWSQSPMGWKITDMSFDGASLVKDYQNQFGKVIAQDGAAALVKKLKTRLTEAQKKYGKSS